MQTVRHNYIANTDIAVFRYEKETFLKICEQFPDINEDIENLIDEKKEYTVNDDFLTKSIKSDKVRKAIINDYQEII